MKGIILYKGKYGATRQYAGWLRDELELPLVISTNCTKEEIVQSDIIIAGSSVYIGKLLIGKWLKSNLQLLQNKKIFLFVVSGTPPDEKQKLQTYIQSSVPGEIRGQCRIHFLPGRMVYKKLSLLDKFMLRIGAMLSKEPEAKTTMLTDYDLVKKENLDELLRDIKRFSAPEMKPELQHS